MNEKKILDQLFDIKRERGATWFSTHIKWWHTYIYTNTNKKSYLNCTFFVKELVALTNSTIFLFANFLPSPSLCHFQFYSKLEKLHSHCFYFLPPFSFKPLTIINTSWLLSVILYVYVCAFLIICIYRRTHLEGWISRPYMSLFCFILNDIMSIES